MKITKDTALAYVNLKTDEVGEVLAVGPTDVTAVLNANLRAAPAYGMDASHVTNTTRKYQCNASLVYAKAVRELRKARDFGTDGAAIRLILEEGLIAMGYGDLVDEVRNAGTDEE